MTNNKYKVFDNPFKDLFITVLWYFLIYSFLALSFSYITDYIFAHTEHTQESLENIGTNDSVYYWLVHLLTFSFIVAVSIVYIYEKGGPRFEAALEFIYKRGFLVIFVAYCLSILLLYIAMVTSPYKDQPYQSPYSQARIYSESMALYRDCIGIDNDRKFVSFNESFDDSVNVKPYINLDTYEVNKGISSVLSKPIYERKGECISKKDWELRLASYKNEIFSCLNNSNINSIYVPGYIFNNKKIDQSDIDTIQNSPSKSSLIHNINTINKKGYERAYHRSSFLNLKNLSDININNHSDLSLGYSSSNNGNYGNCSDLIDLVSNSKSSSAYSESLNSCDTNNPDPAYCLDEYIDKTMNQRDEIKSRLMEGIPD